MLRLRIVNHSLQPVSVRQYWTCMYQACFQTGLTCGREHQTKCRMPAEISFLTCRDLCQQGKAMSTLP